MVRDGKIDSLKGLLISFVVLGHCLTYGEPHDGIKTVLSNCIYIFHMPLFVLLSGYFTHVDSKHFWKGMLLILESYVVFQLIKGWLSDYSLMEYLTTPAPMMWYLWALLIWRAATFIWNQLCFPKYLDYAVLVILFFVALGVGFVDRIGALFALSRLCVFAPFFWLGFMAQKKDVSTFLGRIPQWLSIVFLLVPLDFVTLCTICDVLNVRQVLRGVNGYGGELLYFIGRAVWYLLAMMMSVGLSSLVGENKLLTIIGRDSLKYYLFHGVVLTLMVKMAMPWPWYMSFVYWIVLMTVFYFFNKTKLSNFILHPISSVIERKS